jgi:tetratricopeptide (TPR) repeat protein
LKYDILITKIEPHYIKSVAKLLSSDPKISLHKAVTMLENLPIPYKKNISKKQVEVEVRQLSALKTTVKIVEVVESDMLGIVTLSGEKEALSQKKDNTANKNENETPRKITHAKKSLPKQPIVQEKKYRSKSKIFMSNEEKKVKPQNRSLITIITSLVIILILAIIVIMGNQNRSKFKIKTQSKIPIKISQKKTKESNSKKNLKISILQKKSNRKAVSPQKEQESLSYLDSAKSVTDDLDKMIKFYKIAISINPKNFNAWTALVSVYREKGMITEAFNARKEMKQIFGDNIFSIKKLVTPYGTLISFKNENGVCRLTYNTKSKQQSIIEVETFQLFRAMNSTGGCSSFSIYAVTKKGKGMLIKLDTKNFPETFMQYKTDAIINFTK